MVASSIFISTHNLNLMPRMNLVMSKHLETMCHNSLFNLIVLKWIISMIFNMAAGSHLEFQLKTEI